MNLLIIGGSGFVSATLARDALAAGHRVWCLTRGRRPLPAGCTALVADREDDRAVDDALAAAGVSWDLAVDCIAFDARHTEQDARLLPGRVRHLVVISTECVYRPDGRPAVVAEDWPEPDPAPYGAGKRRAEQVLLGGAAGAMPWTILRPGHIYGPGSQLGCLPLHGRDPRLIERLRAGEPLRLLAGGELRLAPIAATDLARICLACAATPGAAGLVANTPGRDLVTARDYYRIIADHLGVPLRVEAVDPGPWLAANPTMAGVCIDRVYSDRALRGSGLPMPATPIAAGLAAHCAALLAPG